MYSPHELMAAQHGKPYRAGMKGTFALATHQGRVGQGVTPMSAVVRELTRLQSEVEELT
jgi:hypothetical protein